MNGTGSAYRSSAAVTGSGMVVGCSADGEEDEEDADGAAGDVGDRPNTLIASSIVLFGNGLFVRLLVMCGPAIATVGLGHGGRDDGASVPGLRAVFARVSVAVNHFAGCWIPWDSCDVGEMFAGAAGEEGGNCETLSGCGVGDRSGDIGCFVAMCSDDDIACVGTSFFVHCFRAFGERCVDGGGEADVYTGFERARGGVVRCVVKEAFECVIVLVLTNDDFEQPMLCNGERLPDDGWDGGIGGVHGGRRWLVVGVRSIGRCAIRCAVRCAVALAFATAGVRV